MDKEERLLAWLLLLHHMAALPAICYGRRRLAQAIRDAPDLVPALLEMLVPLMDLPPPPTKGLPPLCLPALPFSR